MATLSMGTARGTGASSGSPQRTASPQPTTYNPQKTVNPQANNVNPMNVYSAPVYTAPVLQDDGGGGGAAAPYVAPYVPPDPYAAWGGRSAYNSLVSGFDAQKNSVYGSVNDATANTGRTLGDSILDFLDSMRVGQQGIDTQGINNDLAKQRGTADVYGGISRGINSGGVTLASKNSGDSSAVDAIARAYGSIGGRQLSSINNQYELENTEIDQAQTMLNMQEASGVRRINTSKELAINDIVGSATEKLASLDAQIANANLPQRIAIDAEKNRLRSEVVGKLAQYDGQLQGGVDSINPMDRNGRMSEATRRNALGAVNPLQFDYQSEVPTQFQNTGPFASPLPVFNYRKPD